MGEVRDGLPMLNMQAVYLVSTGLYKEKQIGILFLAFGLAQFLLMAPAGYILDYSNQKIRYLIGATLSVSAVTVLIALIGRNGNMVLQIVLHALQGACTAIIPPAFNGITLGITGQAGLTEQVSRNRSMMHWGTVTLVVVSCTTAYYTYPHFAILFTASPVAACIATYLLRQIPSQTVHRDAARGLIAESPTMTEYCLADDVAACKQAAALQRRPRSTHIFFGAMPYQPPVYRASSGMPMVQEEVFDDDDDVEEECFATEPEEERQKNEQISKEDRRRSMDISIRTNTSDSSLPSFQFGWGKRTRRRSNTTTPAANLEALTPLEALSDPLVRIFAATCFLFHLANSSVLPLVMQSLALQDRRSGIVLSGLCILIAQACMAVVARWSGLQSGYRGRKPFVLLGLTALCFRCLVLAALMYAKDNGANSVLSGLVLQLLLLSTQLLDALGAGIMGIMQVLVTSDITGGSGRFSFILGVMASATCLGCTVSGYLGQAIAQDYGYEWAFTALGLVSLIPIVLFQWCMPETLPDFEPVLKSRRQRFRAWWRRNGGGGQGGSGMAAQGTAELI